jgi:hypothetical protein
MTDKVPDRTDLHAYIFPCYYVYINLCRHRNMFLCTQLHIPPDSYETKTPLYRSGRKKSP